MATRSKHHHPHAPHGGGIDAAKLVDSVQEMCRARGERMTDVRRDVLNMLARLDKAQTAYQILAEINRKRSPKLSAMSLYRTLDFLIGLGVVVKLDSQNTFKLCADHPHAHSHLMMICDSCGAAQEVDDHAATERLESLARRHGHKLNHHVIELHGTCGDCAD